MLPIRAMFTVESASPNAAVYLRHNAQKLVPGSTTGIAGLSGGNRKHPTVLLLFFVDVGNILEVTEERRFSNREWFPVGVEVLTDPSCGMATIIAILATIGLI
jgi:hypothetical protein